jgi:hypothetical protein
VIAHHVDHGAARLLAQSQRPGDRRGHQVHIGYPGQVSEDHAIAEPASDPRRNLKAKPSLAGPSGPGQRDQTVACQQFVDLPDLLCPTDEPGELSRQIRQTGFLCPTRRKVLLHAIDHQLEQPFRLQEILQPVLAEITQPRPAGQTPLYQTPRGIGQKNLTAIRRRRDPGRPVHVQPDVVGTT